MWNLSIADTLGTAESVGLKKKFPLFRGSLSM